MLGLLVNLAFFKGGTFADRKFRTDVDVNFRE